jgi:hypothetical protein
MSKMISPKPASGKSRFKWLLIFLLLTSGVINYFLFRSDIILFRSLGFHHESVRLSNRILQAFFSGYFSDICWCIALGLVTECCSDRNLLNSAGKIIILVLPFALEIAQYFRIIPGTFDWIDLGIYALIIFIFSLRLFQIPRS